MDKNQSEDSSSKSSRVSNESYGGSRNASGISSGHYVEIYGASEHELAIFKKTHHTVTEHPPHW